MQDIDYTLNWHTHTHKIPYLTLTGEQRYVCCFIENWLYFMLFRNKLLYCVLAKMEYPYSTGLSQESGNMIKANAVS